MPNRLPSYTLALSTALALAGCGAGSLAPATATTNAAALGAPAWQRAVRVSGLPAQRGWLAPGAQRVPLVYVSDFSANAIEIYKQGNTSAPIGAITDGIDGPLGNFVDKSGKLYVANAMNDTVTEYPRGATSPSVTLSSDLTYPISVAVDAHGTVAVGEFSAGTILEFKAGSTTPDVQITLLTLPEGLAFDRSRHLWAAWNVSTGSGLTGHVSKCQPLKAVCVDRGIAIGESGGLTIDATGNLALGDQTNAVIGVYAPGATSPSRTISTTGRDPYKFSLDKAEKTLYMADITNNLVATYDYTTGAQVGTISSGLTSAWGVSLSPAAAYGP